MAAVMMVVVVVDISTISAPHPGGRYRKRWWRGSASGNTPAASQVIGGQRTVTEGLDGGGVTYGARIDSFHVPSSCCGSSFSDPGKHDDEGGGRGGLYPCTWTCLAGRNRRGKSRVIPQKSTFLFLILYLSVHHSFVPLVYPIYSMPGQAPYIEIHSL